MDEPGLRRVIRHLVDRGVDGVVPTGTTGESATLTDSERRLVWEIAVDTVRGQVPVIAGAGTNDTRHSIELTRLAAKAGVDGVLAVAPYYNRPTQRGLIEHFRAVAGSTDLPVMLYNIPSRTGVNIDTWSVLQLAEIDNVVGIKDASGDLRQTMDLIQDTEGFAVLSGEDHLLFATSCLGGHGAIAASAHLFPDKFKAMHALVGEGRIKEARVLHYRLLPLIRLLFAESNPSPIKAAYELLGLSSGETRLPLVRATDGLVRQLRAAIDSFD